MICILALTLHRLLSCCCLVSTSGCTRLNGGNPCYWLVYTNLVLFQLVSHPRFYRDDDVAQVIQSVRFDPNVKRPFGLPRSNEKDISLIVGRSSEESARPPSYGHDLERRSKDGSEEEIEQPMLKIWVACVLLVLVIAVSVCCSIITCLVLIQCCSLQS